jgi:hypothetical protein
MTERQCPYCSERYDVEASAAHLVTPECLYAQALTRRARVRVDNLTPGGRAWRSRQCDRAARRTA